MAEEKKRSLSTAFFDRLKSGDLHHLVETLKFKDESNGTPKKHKGVCASRFRLGLRGDAVIVYYKGNKALTIFEKQKAYKNNKDEIKVYDYMMITDSYYEDIIKRNVYKKVIKPKIKEEIVHSEAELYVCFNDFKIEDWRVLLSLIADGIEKYEAQDKSELEAEQRIWYENNFSKISNDIDYLILDTEYAKGEGRFDLVAMYWPDHKKNPGIAFIELKYGIGVVGGGSKEDKSTMVDHWKNFCNYKFTDEDNIDMTKMFWQLYMLDMYRPNIKKNGRTITANIIKKYTNYEKWENYKEKMFDMESYPVQLIFALANYNADSKKLSLQVKKIEDSMKNKTIKPKMKNIEVLYAVSSFMGYGLYRKCMFNRKKMEIFCNLLEL